MATSPGFSSRMPPTRCARGRTPTRGKFGYTGWKKSYGADGKLQEARHAGYDGRDGFFARLVKYDGAGKVSEVSYLDAGGKPAQHKDGYARWTAARNPEGTRTEV